jgi:16S rRNA (cytidine1402-2'-O)-methyltransferase
LRDPFVTIDSPLLLRAAAAAAGAQAYPEATLYVVATPVGNLADLSLRAIHVLALVDALACEDTRVAARLLRHLGIDDKPLLAAHAHNEREAALRVIERLGAGERIAYVSDAGTPGVSDPGAALVAAVQSAGYRCLPIPGPSSLLAALSVAGDATAAQQGFAFCGFLPARGTARAEQIAHLARAAPAQLVFEAPHRIAALLDALAAACPERRITVCRELTKQFEGVATLTARDAPAWLGADPNRRRGEFVLMLHACDPTGAAEPAQAERLLALLLRELPLKQAVAIAAEASGAARNALYRRALALRDDG